MIGVLDRLAVANKLPLGHYDRKSAEKEVDNEYALSREYEKIISVRLHKRSDLKPYYHNQSTAIEICNAICDYWQIPRIKTVVLNSHAVKECAAGHYSKGEIHLKSKIFNLITLIHELAHHFSIKDKKEFGHGKIFVMYEGIVTDTFFQLF